MGRRTCLGFVSLLRGARSRQMGPSISTTMHAPLPRGDYPRVASKIATKEKNGPKYVRRVQSSSRSGGEVGSADWVGAMVGHSRRGGDQSAAAGVGEGLGEAQTSSWCLGNNQESKIAAKPGPPRAPVGVRTGGLRDSGSKRKRGPGVPRLGRGSGLLAAAEGNVCVRSLDVPWGLGMFSLEFEKHLAPHFFNRQQTRR